MVLFQRFTIWRKIKFKAVIFVLILVGLFTGGLFFSRDKEPVEWGPLTVLEINSGDSCTFVDPQEGYYHVTLDRNKLVFPEIINHQACDCKIDDDKILVAYINTKSPSELIFKVITKGNSQRRIILETLSNQRIEEGAYPKIYITEGAYYVLSGRFLYKLSKADLKIEKIQLENYETPLITRDGRLFLDRVISLFWMKIMVIKRCYRYPLRKESVDGELKENRLLSRGKIWRKWYH